MPKEIAATLNDAATQRPIQIVNFAGVCKTATATDRAKPSQEAV